jgi:PKD repeat protein
MLTPNRLVKKLMEMHSYYICVFMLLLPMSTNAEQLLSLFIDGQVQPYLEDPSGNFLGVEPDTGQLRRGVEDAKLNLGATQSYIEINSPVTGVYNVSLFGTYDGSIMISVGYYDTVSGAKFEEIHQVLFHGQSINFSVELDPRLENPLKVNSPAGESLNNLKIVASNSDGKLTWDESNAPDVIGYRIYARPKQSSLFKLLGEVTSNYFDTPHLLRVDNSGEHWKYIVVSHTDDGRESFYSSVINNLITVAAFFDTDVRTGSTPLTVAFSDDSLGEPSSWSWDFDGDGLEDSNKQNPSFTFEMAGSYDVTLKISGEFGTEEATRFGYIQVEAPVVIEGDLDDDGDVDRNDINIIMALRNSPATGPDDPNDIDGDGTITVLDARRLMLLCTRARCAVN